MQPHRLMPGFWRWLPLAVCASMFASPGDAQHTRRKTAPACEASSEASAVFVGVAGAPVTRRVQLPNRPAVEMSLTPVTVERAYFGVITPVVYLMAAGVEHVATVGRRYLVYGREYRPPDIVMVSPGDGAKPVENAADDLAFLDRSGPAVKGGTISGVVQYKGSGGAAGGLQVPLEGVVVRISGDRHSADAVTAADGRFSVSVPAGVYRVMPELADDLMGDSRKPVQATVTDGGCAVVRIDASFNGRVRGVLRGPDGLPLPRTTVDLMPIDVEPEHTGGITGAGSARTNDQGEFEFAGRPAGRYYLGVGLYKAPNPYGPSYPRTYYPGTTDRNSALPVVVERGGASDAFDFSVPMILPKGELEATVESEYAGELKLCFVQLGAAVRRSSSYTPRRGVPQRLPVVDGEPYEVHVHLEYPGGHLESEPFQFTATAGKTVVRLRPDAPRELHR